MKLSFTCFIITAHTLHMGETAKQLSLTQQSVSEHIKRLEQEYDTQLFYRRPKLTLTPNGKIFLRFIQNIAVIENNFKNELKTEKSNFAGTINFGIGTYRLHDILPPLLVQFREKFPNVRINILYEDNSILEKFLLEGKLDIFTGFNVEEYSEFERTTIIEEKTCILISDYILNLYFSPDAIKKICAEGIGLQQLVSLPFLSNYPDGKLWKFYQQILDEAHVKLNIVLSNNDVNELIQLCAFNYGALFCPDYLHTTINTYNYSSNRFNLLHLIPVQNSTATNKIDLVNHRYVFKSEYLKYFIGLIKKMHQH